jgi:hypothetical protein
LLVLVGLRNPPPPPTAIPEDDYAEPSLPRPA